MRFASCCARLRSLVVTKTDIVRARADANDQRRVIRCLFRGHLRSCLRTGSPRLANAWAEGLVALGAPRLQHEWRAVDVALGGSAFAASSCRQKQRESGNIAVISLSLPAVGCAGLSHPQLVATEAPADTHSS